MHHWVIETPAGPVSRGSCQRCGETRFFANSDDRVAFGELADKKPWCSKCGCALSRGRKAGHERTCAGAGRRVCLGCERTLRLEEFPRSSTGKRRSRCRSCSNAKRGAA